MKKQEMEQLTIGTVVANKLAQYTITKIEDIDGAKVYTLDDIRTAKETTMKRNYTLVHLAEQETTEEPEPEETTTEEPTEETTEQVTLAIVEPQPEAQTEEPTSETRQIMIEAGRLLLTNCMVELEGQKMVVNQYATGKSQRIDNPQTLIDQLDPTLTDEEVDRISNNIKQAFNMIAEFNGEETTEETEEPQPVVNPTVEATEETTLTKKQLKAQAKAKILALNKTITEAIDADLRGNLSYIVEDRKGRIAIKVRPVDETKPRVILDLVLNSKGAKAHVRREAINNIEYYRAKNMTKALPERWALNLEVQIDSLDTLWDLLDSGLNFELARREAKKNKQEEKKQATA